MEAAVAPLSERAARAGTRSAAAAPWPLHAAVFAATSIAIGVEWDISWHKTIGRDTFWTPAHMAIYLGGLVAGLSCGWLVLRTTFAGSAEQKGATVGFWGFRGPLGAWVSIWGAIAMIASAPFDDWWHDAYGLDVEILSPPHTVLALGIVAIATGALLMTVAAQNRAAADVATAAAAAGTPRGGAAEGRLGSRRHEAEAAGAPALFAYAAGLIVLMAAIMTTEYSYRIYMHTSVFYKVACGVFPFIIVAAARASRLRWPATTVVAVYSGVRLLMLWILPLFPAEPKLGPIFQDVTHMVPPDFPLLLIVPAFFLDLVLRRFDAGRRDWLLAGALGAVFLTTFLLAQWPFAEFLLSPASRNRVFATDNFFYALSTESYSFRGEFYPLDADGAALRQGLLVALGLAAASARLGLWWGAWLARVRR